MKWRPQDLLNKKVPSAKSLIKALFCDILPMLKVPSINAIPPLLNFVHLRSITSITSLFPRRSAEILFQQSTNHLGLFILA